MTGFVTWWRRLVATLHGEALDDQTDEELQFHLEQETEAAMRRGLSRDQAVREARIRSGVALSAREAVRDQRGLPWLDDLISDLRISARGLARQRGFATVTITALALAVAINTMIFALVDGVLLQPLPYDEPDRLVRMFESGEKYPKFPMSAAFFLEVARDNQTLDDIALYTGEDLQLMHDGRPENLTAVRVSDRFFPLLGVQPILGRNFDESEMRGSPHVVILSHSLWVNRFDQDPDIVGRTIRLNRENWTVIGVLPPGFEHVGGAYRSPLQGATVSLWWPVGLDLPESGMYQWHFMNAVARMKPGVTLQQVEHDTDRLAEEHEKRYPDGHKDWRALVAPLEEEVVGGSRQTVLLLIGAGGLVLLIACANIAGLCIARGLARRREVAIRQALGARAGRLVRALIAENLLLGVAGGIAGFALAAAAMPLLKVMLPSDFPRIQTIHLNLAVGGFALLSAIITAVAAGLIPALRQTQLDPRDALQEEPRGASAGIRARRLRAALVAGEIALAALLCAATILMARSAYMLGEREHGFDGRGVLAFSLPIPSTAYGKPEASSRLFDEITRAWRQIPGVEAAGLGTDLPWTGYDENSGFRIVGRDNTESGEGQGRYHSASPGFFEALRVPLLRGRLFNEHDRRDSPLVAIINNSLAQRYFPGENPVGRVLNLWGSEREVVGVVADIRDRPSDPLAEPAYWYPTAQEPTTLHLQAALRTSGDPLALVPAVAAALHSVDPELPMADIRSVEAIVNSALAERRFALWLFEAFAVLALGLAAVGIYGLLAYLVEQRRKELGIRMALGANRTSIVRMVLGDGVRLCVVGVVAGLMLVPFAARGLASFLYGVQATDAVSLLAATLVILMVVLAASFVPAWSASRCHPMSALREE